MDIDENKSTTTTATAPAKKALAKPKKKKKVATPSASSESASTHPDMSLAQDIHRLVMVHDGKLSIEDASSIAGTSTSDLLERVMSRVGTGGKAVGDAMRVNGARHAPPQVEGGDDDGAPASASSPAAVAEDGKGGEDDDDDVGGGESLLNPSLYRHLRSTLSYASPSALSESDLDALTAHHEVVLSSLRSAITRASDEAGDMEVLHASMDVARYAARCCDMGAAADAYLAVLALPKLSAGKRLDAHLEMARVRSFWGDFRGMGDALASAAKAIAKGGDWDRRNRLKVYQALSFLLVRDVGSASKLLVEGIATFSCAELCDYPEFVTYAIVTGLLSLKRTELKKSIIDGSEVLQVAKDIPVLVSLLCNLSLLCGIPSFYFGHCRVRFARVRACVCSCRGGGKAPLVYLHLIRTGWHRAARMRYPPPISPHPHLSLSLHQYAFQIRLANTLYDCDYKAYLHALVDLQPHLIANRYLQPHAGYLLRELHVLAYHQFLDSYQSVTLESMAASFGVGTEFLDVQLSRFIAAGRLTAKIDKFGGVVETNRPDWKNASYQEMIQKGDLLLNRIQKLGRVVDL